jgi:hypothetical protein
MGASLKRPPGSKRAKKELLLRDTSLSASTANSAAIKGLARSHNNIAATLNLKEQIATVQMEFTMYRELGDDGSARHCSQQLKQLRAKLDSINTMRNPLAGVTYGPSSTGDQPPVEEVDLTGGDQLDSQISLEEISWTPQRTSPMRK